MLGQASSKDSILLSKWLGWMLAKELTEYHEEISLSKTKGEHL